MPLTSTGGVFGHRWSEHHKPVAESTMTARCTILGRPTAPTGLDGPGPAPVLATDVPCRVQQHQSTAAQPVPAGQEITVHGYLITVPADTPVDFVPGTLGHQILITRAAPGTDRMLPGRRFDVVDVATGSEVWERDLICEENTTQNEGAGGDAG